MANCCVCGKRLGMFDGSSISLESKYSAYYSCPKCSTKIKALKARDVDSIAEFKTFAENLDDERLKEFFIELTVTKEEQERLSVEKKEKAQKEAEELKEKVREFKKIVNTMMVTTGYNFEGYKISQYKTVISGECVLGTGFLSELGASFSDLTGGSSNSFSNKLREAKNQALYLLKESCHINGGNAIIGVDFDYITFSNNMIGVVANGTAVVIEKL